MGRSSIADLRDELKQKRLAVGGWKDIGTFLKCYTQADADTMLDYINPNAKKPDQVVIFTREGCGFCAKAKAQLTALGYDYADVPLEHHVRSKVVGALAGAQTVPQIFINGAYIGGAEALDAWAQRAA